jgi:HemK-like putative methylase
MLKKHFENYKDIKVLDIFSGSGCLGISIAKNLKNSIVDFSDINENYIKQIKINLKINKIKNFKKVIKSDIFDKIPGKYDLILANPPYVPASDAIQAPFEDRKAILAGKDGLKLLKPFLAQLKAHLNSNGICIIEHHPDQVKVLKTMLLKHGFNNFEFRKDQYQRSRYAIIQISKNK